VLNRLTTEMAPNAKEVLGRWVAQCDCNFFSGELRKMKSEFPTSSKHSTEQERDDQLLGKKNTNPVVFQNTGRGVKGPSGHILQDYTV